MSAVMKRLRKFQFEEKMDMTPLIDCVFLLIMFFILTTEITMKSEKLLLPFALEGTQEKGPTEDITKLIQVPVKVGQELNRIGEIKCDGKVLSQKELQDALQEAVIHDMSDPPYGRGRAPEITPEGKQLSQLKVRIRADKRVRAEYLRKIFMACALVNPAIYKIEISSEQPGKQ